jgi:hypothetical protein
MSNRPLPIFCSNNTFRIKQLIIELESNFISPKVREELINHFCKFKQTYWAFTKLARIWKIKHTPIRIQTDLYMNELDLTNPYTFQLVHPNGIYLFSLQNLARLIVDAITHQSGMFVEPLTIKNPYTNDLLSKSDLVNIYLTLKRNHIRIHEMLEKFFRCEFNIFEFRMKYETELRDLAIEQYANTANPQELAQDVDDMLRLHKMTKRINIAAGFSQKKLVETMRPFLKVYLLERFSFSSMTRKYSTKKLDLMLSQFADNNPTYGKRITSEFVPPPNSNPFSPSEQYIKKESTYVTNTTPYGEYCSSKYMSTHVYNEYTFDRYVETGDRLDTYVERRISRNNRVTHDDHYSEEEWEEDPPQIVQTRELMQIVPAAVYQFSSNENTRAILSRIGRLAQGSVSEIETPSNYYITNNIIHNDINSNIINDLNMQNNEDVNEEEDEDEEVIHNTENENRSESDSDWGTGFEDDDMDSVS